ncbi:MAG: hypothetical protein NZ900_09035 [Synergistetes bacterium]|nr:hypothetical protein [Synergistota bacterium]MDW8193061.1 hypothetical protein [Synergistota bacterium]
MFFLLGFISAVFLFFLRGERLIREGALFFYKNKSLFKLKEEIEEELKDLLSEIKMEREALQSLKLEARFLADKLEALIIRGSALKDRDSQ